MLSRIGNQRERCASKRATDDTRGIHTAAAASQLGGSISLGASVWEHQLTSGDPKFM